MPRQKSITSVISTQLPMFSEFTDPAPQVKVPLPVIAASKFGFELPYIIAENGKEYFRLLSWLTGCVGDKAGETVRNLRKRGVFSKVPPVGFQNPQLFILNEEASGSGYDQDFEYVLDGVLYGITQDLRSTKDRPVIQSIKDYLRDAGVKMDEYRRAPEKAIKAGVQELVANGMDEQKAKARARGIVARVDFGFVAKVTHEDHDPNYKVLTAHVNLNLFGRGKAAIVAELGLTDAEARQFRNHLDTFALQALEAAETAAARKMESMGRPLNDEEQIEIVVHCARLAAPAFKAMAEYAGNDLATGRKLIGKANK